MYKRKYNPSHKKINLAGKVVAFEEDGITRLKIKINASQLYSHFLKMYAKPGDWASMEITLKKPKRSESQNSFYHVYLSLIEISSGHTIEELKAWVNEDILGKGISEVFGHTTRIVGHTSDLNMSEFCEMMNQIQERTNIPIPDPSIFNMPMSFDEYHNLKIIQNEKYKKMTANKIM